MTGFVRTEFATTDPDVAQELMNAAYQDTEMRLIGNRRDLRLEQVRYDLGPIQLDRVHQTLGVDFVNSPFERLQIIRLVDHAMTIEMAGDVRRFGPGDVFLAAQPDESFLSRFEKFGLQSVGMDLSSIAEVTGEPPLEVVRRFRAGALPTAQAGLWQRTVAYATDTLTRPGAGAPLVLDNLRRLLAGVTVTAFDAGVVVDVPRDRADATPVAVRRAVAFVETNPDAEIGVVDVARAAHVSVRALQLAFRRHLDTTPMAYLRRVRMDRVRADLVAADPAGTTVTAVTSRWGFHAVGRFSADYRDTYGELPRDTLRRR